MKTNPSEHRVCIEAGDLDLTTLEEQVDYILDLTQGKTGHEYTLLAGLARLLVKIENQAHGMEPLYDALTRRYSKEA